MADSSTMPWYHVNVQLLPVKLIYFTFLAAVGDLLPFITIYMKQLGLSSTEVGLIYGVMPFVAFLFRPLFGALSDKTRQYRLVLMVCTLLTGICYCLLLVTPVITPPGPMQHKMGVRTQIQCNPIDSYVVDCEATKNDTGKQAHHQCQQSLRTFSAEQFTENSSDITCSATCGVTISPMNLYACFTDDVTPSYEEICLDKWNSTSTGRNLQFSINDLSAVVKNEVITGVGYNWINCEQYDLKNISYKGHDFWQFTCNAEAVFDCDITCNETLHKSCISVATTEFNQTFWVFFVIFFACNVFFSPVLSIVDAIAYDILGDKRGRWGMQRLWGTVGFTLFAITSTFIMDSISKSKETIDYNVSFYIFLFLCTLSAIVTYFLKFSELKYGTQMCQNMVTLLKYPKVVTFLLLITCFGIMSAVIEAFLFWYLQDLGSTQIILGLCIFMNCVPETVILMFSGKIIKKIGHVPCFYLTALCYSARFFYYSFMTNAWYVLLIEPLHCITFGLMYAAASSYASIIAPEGMSASVQCLVGGLQFGFGKGIGCLITGKLFDRVSGFGEVWTFRFYGFFALVVLVLYASVQYFCLWEPDKSSEQSLVQPGPDGDHTAAKEQLLGTNAVNNDNAEL